MQENENKQILGDESKKIKENVKSSERKQGNIKKSDVDRFFDLTRRLQKVGEKYNLKIE